jgi:hypothetical protein
VDDHPEQAALAGDEDVAEVGADPRGRRSRSQAGDQRDPGGPLRDEHLAVREKPDVPAVPDVDGAPVGTTGTSPTSSPPPDEHAASTATRRRAPPARAVGVRKG